MGRVFKYGDNVDTDVIIPARYLNTSDPEELKKHCMYDIDTNFCDAVRVGDYIVAGENFGCGSSREHAPISIKASGVKCVIAKSFARIFYRNAFNIGLTILESEILYDEVKNKDEIEVDLAKGIIRNITSGKEYKTKIIPEFMQRLINLGGLVNYVKEKGVK